MGLLPEFFTLLGIEIFAAMSLVSVLLDRDIPSSVQWLFQGAAGLGLGQLVVTEGFGTSRCVALLDQHLLSDTVSLQCCGPERLPCRSS